MKPVEQTIIGEEGNCFAACLATLLEVSIGIVPNFLGDDWFDQYVAWLAPYNLGLFSFRVAQAYHWPWYMDYAGYAILGGASPRLPGSFHAVIVRKGEIIFDPHPKRHMGIGEHHDITFIVVLNPSKPIGLMKETAMDGEHTERFTEWCVVELMGHVRMAGLVSEEERFGVKMGRIDVPNPDGSMFTQYFGGSSVYRITPTTEDIARAVAARNVPQPVQRYELPAPGAASTPQPERVPFDDRDDLEVDSWDDDDMERQSVFRTDGF
jgi:hypothetical protein